MAPMKEAVSAASPRMLGRRSAGRPDCTTCGSCTQRRRQFAWCKIMESTDRTPPSVSVSATNGGTE